MLSLVFTRNHPPGTSRAVALNAGEAMRTLDGRMKCLFVLIFAIFGLSGCAWQVEMMPRDSGKVYIGQGRGDGLGGGTMTINIEGRTYSGPVMRTASNDSFGFFQAYGPRGQTTMGTATSIGGSIHVKALLSSADNRGLRCDFSGDNSGHLGGICIDDDKRVYDVLANR